MFPNWINIYVLSLKSLCSNSDANIILFSFSRLKILSKYLLLCVWVKMHVLYKAEHWNVQDILPIQNQLIVFSKELNLYSFWVERYILLALIVVRFTIQRPHYSLTDFLVEIFLLFSSMLYMPGFICLVIIYIACYNIYSMPLGEVTSWM